MDIRYSEHARKRMKQRAVTEPQIEFVLTQPMYIRKVGERMLAAGSVSNRTIKIVFIEAENYINIVMVM